MVEPSVPQEEIVESVGARHDREAIALRMPCLTSLKAVGLSAGDLRIAVLSEVDQLLEDSRGNPVEASKAGLGRLQASGLISPQEANRLGKICTLIFEKQRNKVQEGDANAQIRGIYQSLIVDDDPSPVALAIASLAAGAQSTISVGQPSAKSVSAAAAAARGFGADVGMVGGAIAGAVIGGAIGGAGGAVIGAVVGGIAGGVAGACAD